MGELPTGIVVTIHDLPAPLTFDQVSAALAMLKPSHVWIDTAGPLRVFLDDLRRAGVHAHALPKPVDGMDAHEQAIRLQNNRGIVRQVEALLRTGAIVDERKRADLLADIEALASRC
jgi:hypothetical protein